MYYNISERNTRRRRKRLLIRALIALIALGILTTVLILVLQKPDLKSTMRTMPFSVTDSYLPFNQGILYTRNSRLYYLNTKDETVFDIKLPADGVSLYASASAIVLYNDSDVWAINLTGEQLFAAQPPGTVISVRANANNIAVLTRDDAGILHIEVYDMLGALLDVFDSSQHILDYGFLQDGSLWVMALDTSGITLVCHVTTYKSATKTINGSISIKDQIVQGLVFTQKTIYAIGTEQIVVCDYLGKESDSVLVYGWKLEDVSVSGEQPVILLSPRTEQAGRTVINAAKIITFPDGNYSIQLPPECFKVLLANDKVYAFTPSILFTYSQKGKLLDTYALPFEVSAVTRGYGNTVLAAGEKEINLLQLP